MTAYHPAIIAQITGFGVFLWLGLYLLLHSANRPPELIVNLIGMFAQAAFFGSGVITDTLTDSAQFVTAHRWSWWTSVLPAAAWFHFSSLVVRRARRRRGQPAGPVLTPLVVVIYAAGAAISLLAGLTNLFDDYAHPISLGGTYAVGTGPAYAFYGAYLALSALGALANVARALRLVAGSPRRGDRLLAQQLRLLLGGGLFFLAGALWLAARHYWGLAVSALPGHLCLVLGLAALGYGAALLGMLLKGQNVRRDFIYSLTGVALVNLLYAAVLALAGQPPAVGTLALVGLVTLTHTGFDSGRNALDALFFSRAERAARAEARAYATILGTAPTPAIDEPPALAAEEPPGEGEPPAEPGPPGPPDDQRSLKEFKNQVRRALTGLKSPPQLANSPLLSLKLVERQVASVGLGDNRLNRAAALRELLIAQIDGLRPISAGQTHRVGEAWRFYNVLHYPYVRELSRKSALAEVRRLGDERRRCGQREPGELEQVLSWLADIDEDTFYKWQRRASDTIATILWEEDRKLLDDDPA